MQPTPTPVPTPGYKTSEFWLTLLAMVVSAIAASGGLAPDSPRAKLVGVVLAVLAALGYTAGRSAVKVAALRAQGSMAEAQSWAAQSATHKG